MTTNQNKSKPPSPLEGGTSVPVQGADQGDDPKGTPCCPICGSDEIIEIEMRANNKVKGTGRSEWLIAKYDQCNECNNSLASKETISSIYEYVKSKRHAKT